MSLESDKYRRAILGAINMANKANDPESNAKWLEHAAEWERMAENIENAEDADDPEGSSNHQTKDRQNYHALPWFPAGTRQSPH
jgi:hypothetical protein